MNSEWPIGPFPLPQQGKPIDEKYVNMLIKAIEDTLRRARAPGNLECQTINGGPP